MSYIHKAILEYFSKPDSDSKLEPITLRQHLQSSFLENKYTLDEAKEACTAILLPFRLFQGTRILKYAVELETALNNHGVIYQNEIQDIVNLATNNKVTSGN